MTKTNYKSSCIYVIEFKNEVIYVGSTTNFTTRKRQHKYTCLNEKMKGYNIPLYKFIRKNGSWDNVLIKKILDFPCETKRELNLKEHEYINTYLNGGSKLLNKKCIGKEYYQQKKYRKNYYNNNKQRILNNVNEYKNNNIDKIKEYQKEYGKNNRDKKNAANRRYKIKNKEKRRIYDAQRLKCPNCGKEMRRDSLRKHKKICKLQN